MPPAEIVRLPPPRFEGPLSVEQTLLARRSVRTFSRDPLTVDNLTQLLWAAQGITHSQGYRTAPSAGAIYPLELYVIVGHMVGLATGLYRYRGREHALDGRHVGVTPEVLALGVAVLEVFRP